MVPDVAARLRARRTVARDTDCMPQVVVVGSLNADLVVALERLPLPGETVLGMRIDRYPGGKGLNQTVAARRMGADVALVGAVGDDEAGAGLRAVLAVESVLDSVTVVAGEASGTALIEVAGDGQNRIVVVPGANGWIGAATVRRVLAALPAPRVVLAQAEIPVEAVRAAMSAGRERGALTVLNASPAEGLPLEVLRHVDVVVVNEHEASILTGRPTRTPAESHAAAQELVALGPSLAVLTRGEHGAAWATAGGGGTVAAFPVDALDTVGAGDAFCGALVDGLSRGIAESDAVRRAAAAGALAATRHGAVPSLPTAAEVDELLERPGHG